MAYYTVKCGDQLYPRMTIKLIETWLQVARVGKDNQVMNEETNEWTTVGELLYKATILPENQAAQIQAKAEVHAQPKATAYSSEKLVSIANSVDTIATIIIRVSIVATAIPFAIFGGLFGHGDAPMLLGAAVGGAIGYGIGWLITLFMRLIAQSALCLAQIEQNTRKS